MFTNKCAWNFKLLSPNFVRTSVEKQPTVFYFERKLPKICHDVTLYDIFHPLNAQIFDLTKTEHLAVNCLTNYQKAYYTYIYIIHIHIYTRGSRAKWKQF